VCQIHGPGRRIPGGLRPPRTGTAAQHGVNAARERAKPWPVRLTHRTFLAEIVDDAMPSTSTVSYETGVRAGSPWDSSPARPVTYVRPRCVIWAATPVYPAHGGSEKECSPIKRVIADAAVTGPGVVFAHRMFPLGVMNALTRFDGGRGAGRDVRLVVFGGVGNGLGVSDGWARPSEPIWNMPTSRTACPVLAPPVGEGCTPDRSAIAIDHSPVSSIASRMTAAAIPFGDRYTGRLPS
jgi:hypothetical protein